jgi:hypothetical protein
MTTRRPVAYVFDGKAMVPEQLWQATRQYEVGKKYLLGDFDEDRSDASHRHYFAAIRKAWQNLPEDKAIRYPTPEHLRKWALIKSGYVVEHTHVCETETGAIALAAFCAKADESAVIIIRGNVVTTAVAESQSLKAMKKERFQKSKQDVIDFCANMIGVDPKTLSAEVSSGDGHGARTEDAPAAVDAAGVIEVQSNLSPDWIDVYCTTLNSVELNRKPLKDRHDMALQMLGGEPVEEELNLMRRAASWVQRRERNQVTQQEYDDAIARLKEEICSEISETPSISSEGEVAPTSPSSQEDDTPSSASLCEASAS